MTTEAERFWAKVAKGDDCWEWQAARDPNGYGRFSVGGRAGGMELAHRVAYRLTHGVVPAELRHRCDNPPCVRPDHLEPGTHAENIGDMVARGRYVNAIEADPSRAARGDRHGTRTHPEAYPRGEQHPVSKLTADQVAELRARYKGRGRGPSQASLAREYGVTQSTVWAALSGRTWR